MTDWRLKAWFRGCSLQERLQRTSNRPSGFDYERVVLALGVVFWHSSLLATGKDFDGLVRIFLGPFAWSLVPMFFAVSGFLVASSLDRSNTLFTFLGLRVLRIVPALAVVVLLSALVLGPLLTIEPLPAYFASGDFRCYFLNIIGNIHNHLPGVFKDNPLDTVNGQLWTVPFELVCYVGLAILAMAGLYRRKVWLLVLLGGCYAAQVGNTILRSNPGAGATGSTIVMAFIAGVVIYQYRSQIVWSRHLLLASALVTYIVLLLPDGSRFTALPIAYVAVYLGLMNPKRNRLLLSGDYSYGIYLYGFPVQQILVAASPLFRQWYANLAAAVPCVFLFAACSWWLVESPALAKRAGLRRIKGGYLNFLVPVADRQGGTNLGAESMPRQTAIGDRCPPRHQVAQQTSEVTTED